MSVNHYFSNLRNFLVLELSLIRLSTRNMYYRAAEHCQCSLIWSTCMYMMNPLALLSLVNYVAITRALQVFLFTHQVSTSHLNVIFSVAKKMPVDIVYDVRWPITENVKNHPSPNNFKRLIFNRTLVQSSAFFEMMDKMAWSSNGLSVFFKALYHFIDLIRLLFLPCDFEDIIHSKPCQATNSCMAFIDPFSSSCSVVRARELQSDFIFISALTEPAWRCLISGSPLPYSYSTSVVLSKTAKEMTFLDRVFNLLAHQVFYTLSFQIDIARYLFGGSRISLYDPLEPNMYIENSHRFLDWPVPVTRALIRNALLDNTETSTTKNQNYSKELELFLKSPYRGFVIFSMSTYISDGKMPDTVKRNFSDTFKRFPEFGFIWRINELEEKYLGENIFYAKWIPQRRLLAEPKTVLLISHCGQNSFLEAAYAGVPILGIPQQGDQFVNGKRIVEFSFGLSLSKDELSVDSLQNAIENLTSSRAFQRPKLIKKMIATEEEFGITDDVRWWLQYRLRHGKESFSRWIIPKAPSLTRFISFGCDLLLFLSAFVVLTAQ